jgi:VWFA-related protein
MASSTAPASAASFAARLAAALLTAVFGSVLLSQAWLLAQGQPPPATQKPPAAQGQGGQAQGQAAQGQPPQDQRPTFRAGANLVRVDVYPTAGGKPVADLKLEDFEVQEDGVPQKVETFEHVVVQAPTSQELAAAPEPNTVAQAREMAADSKSRLFVIFLDTYHISRGGSMNVRDALVRFLRRALGPDDMVAVTTPEVSASTVTFARRTGTIEELVDRFYRWSKRDAITEFDPVEEMYMRCYPAGAGDSGSLSSTAREMIQRRRERLTIEALQSLVVHLGGVREERKAVLAISEGWVLYQRTGSLTGGTPTQSGLGLTPGQLMNLNSEQARCDADRYALSQEDHQRDFWNMLDDANRANVSFYPLDPRGLVVFDTSLSEGSVDLVIDAARLRARLESLQTMAANTDGLAIVNSNDLDRGLRRVVDDLTSYYLIGYYSTNSKLDGRFRSIKVKVKRSGVDVRARRGYRAPTKDELDSRDKAIAVAATPLSPVASVLGSLSRMRAQSVVQAQAGYIWTADGSGGLRPTLWLAGEWDPSIANRDDQWKAGAEVTVAITAPDKASLENSKQTLTREARSFFLRVPVPAGQTAGEYAVRLTTKPAGTTLGSTETLRVVLPKAPAAGAVATGQPIAFRRGPFSGPNWQPAGDLRFRRQERVKVEFSVAGPMTGSSVRLLDRSGNPLGVPVIAAEREENGGKVVSGEVMLAPLTVGDYVLEATINEGTTTHKVLAAFRIVP